MEKTIGFAVACAAVLFAGQCLAFGGGSGGAGPYSGAPNYGGDSYNQNPYGSGSNSGGGFGSSPSYSAPGYSTPGYSTPGYAPAYGGGSGNAPAPGQAQGYGTYPSAPSTGYDAYPQAPSSGYGAYAPGPSGGFGANPPAQYPSGQEDYDIPRDSSGRQYQQSQGYAAPPQAPAYGYPGYGYPPPRYRDRYPYDRDGDRNSSGFPNPMNMMKSPMNMFGGSNRD